jgi:hypothetical protein
MLHPNTEEALQTIDAGFFSGDEFHNLDDLARVVHFIGRWEKEAKEIIKQKLKRK